MKRDGEGGDGGVCQLPFRGKWDFARDSTLQFMDLVMNYERRSNYISRAYTKILSVWDIYNSPPPSHQLHRKQSGCGNSTS